MIHWKFVWKVLRLKLNLPRQKWPMNKTSFLKMVTLVFKTFLPGIILAIYKGQTNTSELWISLYPYMSWNTCSLTFLILFEAVLLYVFWYSPHQHILFVRWIFGLRKRQINHRDVDFLSMEGLLQEIIQKVSMLPL